MKTAGENRSGRSFCRPRCCSSVAAPLRGCSLLTPRGQPKSLTAPSAAIYEMPSSMSARHGNRLGFERELWQQGTTLVAGVDEAGCGPLAGPVVAAAVVFPHSWLEAGLHSKLRGLNDSKQLAKEQREKYFDFIISHIEIRH